MALSLATAIRNNMATQFLNALDAGAGAAILRIYDGTRPAAGGTATTLLAEITLADPSGTVSGGVLTFSGMPRSDVSANATGTATWARLVDSTGAFVGDLDVGVSGSDLNLGSVALSVGIAVIINSLTYTAPNA